MKAPAHYEDDPSHTLRKRRIRVPFPFFQHRRSSTNKGTVVRGGGAQENDKPQLLPSLRGATANEHDADIWRLSLPALLTLVVDPALSLVDTAYVGRYVGGWVACGMGLLPLILET